MPEDLDGGSRAFSDVTAAIVALAERGGQLSLLSADEDGWRDVLGRVDRLRDPRFLIAVCGEFSSGKSVLLGALMGRPELFPDGVGATTAVPTIVAWGDAERISIRTAGCPDGFTIGPADLAQYVTEQGNPRNEREVREVLIDLPVPLLRDGICFVDLPGTGSTYAPHALVANAFLEKIDAAIFVTPSSAVKQSEVDFLRRVTGRVGDALVIALTKSDLIGAQYGEDGVTAAVADVRKKAADGLGVTPESLVIIPVSALSHQLALGDPQEEQASNIPALDAAIGTSISARAGSLLATDALDELSGALGDALEYGRERLTAVTEGRTPEILKIQSELAARLAWLQDIASREPEWTQQLRRRLDAVGRDTFHELNGRLHTIRTDAIAALENSGDALDANAFTSGVINKVHDQYATSASALEDQVNAALDELAGQLTLTLGRVQADTAFRGTAASAFVEPVPARRFTGPVRRFGEAANRAARKSSGWRAFGIGLGVVAGAVAVAATGGLAAGGIVAGLALAGGASLGGAAGAAVGTAAGTAARMGEELAELDRADPETRRRRLREHVTNALTPNQAEASDRLAKLIDTLQKTTVDLLKRSLGRERKLVEAKIKQLSEDLDRTRAGAAAEADALRPQLATLESDLIPEAARLWAMVAAEERSLSAWKKAREQGDAEP